VLLGNVLLFEFDRLLNGRGITCLRYIDDFILFGPDARSVRKAFQNGVSMLRGLGLTAYDPEDASGKAREGWVRDGFELLGCRIIPGLITPTRKAQERIKEGVEDVFREGERHLREASGASFDAKRHSVATIIYKARNLVRGWVDQYKFCNDENFRRNLDTWFRSRVRRYLSRVDALRSNEPAYLHALGFGLFEDGKRAPFEVEEASGVSAEVA
jgi:hypothetical protein